jgi:hypothetical protein
MTILVGTASRTDKSLIDSGKFLSPDREKRRKASSVPAKRPST